jgi:hypothetical protein
VALVKEYEYKKHHVGLRYKTRGTPESVRQSAVSVKPDLNTLLQFTRRYSESVLSALQFAQKVSIAGIKIYLTLLRVVF